MTVSVKLGKNLRFHVFWGLKTWYQWWFHWNWGFGDVKGRRPLTSPKSPSFNEYHHWFSSFHTPRTREYRKVLPKLHWIPSYKNKINMSVFPLKPSFSHFSISFLLWIPSSSLSDQESRDTLPTSPYPLVLWQFSTCILEILIAPPARSYLLLLMDSIFVLKAVV